MLTSPTGTNCLNPLEPLHIRLFGGDCAVKATLASARGLSARGVTSPSSFKLHLVSLNKQAYLNLTYLYVS
jgi:hypothetical protein